MDWKWQRIANFALIQHGITGIRGAISIDDVLLKDKDSVNAKIRGKAKAFHGVVTFDDLSEYPSTDSANNNDDNNNVGIDMNGTSTDTDVASVGAMDQDMDINSCLNCLSTMINVTSKTYKLERLLQRVRMLRRTIMLKDDLIDFSACESLAEEIHVYVQTQTVNVNVNNVNMKNILSPFVRKFLQKEASLCVLHCQYMGTRQLLLHSLDVRVLWCMHSGVEVILPIWIELQKSIKIAEKQKWAVDTDMSDEGDEGQWSRLLVTAHKIDEVCAYVNKHASFANNNNNNNNNSHSHSHSSNSSGSSDSSGSTSTPSAAVAALKSAHDNIIAYPSKCLGFGSSHMQALALLLSALIDDIQSLTATAAFEDFETASSFITTNIPSLLESRDEFQKAVTEYVC